MRGENRTTQAQVLSAANDLAFPQVSALRMVRTANDKPGIATSAARSRVAVTTGGSDRAGNPCLPAWQRRPGSAGNHPPDPPGGMSDF